MSVAVCHTSIDDIEDAPPISVEARPVREEAQPLALSALDHVAPDVDEDTRRRVPGAQAIYVKTFGCSHNQSDSEYMMGILQAYGYRYARGRLDPAQFQLHVHPAALCLVLDIPAHV